MSIPRHHAEWLSLVEASGPFLSMPVLLEAFPQGLEAHNPELLRSLRLAYEEWEDNQQGLTPDPAIHRAWVEFVLREVLGFPVEVLLSGQQIPAGLGVEVAEHQETLRPDWVVVDPNLSPVSPLPRGEGVREGVREGGGVKGGTGRPRLLIWVVPAGQDLDRPLVGSRWKASVATRMMELLHGCDVRLGLVTNGDRWMLVNAPRGETTGFISWYGNLWLEEQVTLRAFCSLLGARRFFVEEPNLEALLAQSVNSQQEVTDQLGDQVRKAVEVLVQALDRIDCDRNRTLLVGISESRLYEAALTVMMRLVFLFSAEERGLLLLGEELYDRNYAVSTLRSQLREMADQQGEEILQYRHDGWCRLLATFRAVYGGIRHDALQLPAYGGDLFNPDRFPFLEGRALGTSWHNTPSNPIPINNRTVLHLLEALQILQLKVPGGGVEPRKLSFRALDIEQIGHVYEGLLDHTAVRATSTVLGLSGTKGKEPEVALAELERELEKGEDELVGYLKKATGRSVSALWKGIQTGSPESSPVGAGSPESSQRNPNIDKPAPTHTPNIDKPAPTHHPKLPTIDSLEAQRLLVACNNDQNLFHRVLPFAKLIRCDTFDYPIVIPAGSVYVTEGSNRRETGTHYTPRSLTEEIVRYTLEPLVYQGVVEGKPKEQWQLNSAKALLQLKICDMAMGSGAFLVQTCRYLAERLVEAWETAEASHPGKVVVAPEGTLSKSRKSSVGAGSPQSSQHRPDINQPAPTPKITPEGQPSKPSIEEQLIPTDADERLIVAKRIVAERCLYGVDKNPLAVEMAKLSLWLETLQKSKPFTFLDHALKWGDSLVGVSLAQLRCWNLDTSEGVQLDIGSDRIRQEVEEAIALRLQIEAKPVTTPQDQQEKAYLLAQADARIKDLRDRCNLLVSSYFAQGTKSEQEALRQRLLLVAKSEADVSESDRAVLPREKELQPFHWELEFPEVFLTAVDPPQPPLKRGEKRKAEVSPLDKGGLRGDLGFHALVGNPPFMGGQKITGALGTEYRDFLVEWIANGKRGSADICAYFFLRGQQLLRQEGGFGLLATNTIAQGDTREVGLDQLVANGCIIPRAVPSRKWPGTASLEVAHVWLRQGNWQSTFILDEKPVEGITSFLTIPGKAVGKPDRLAANQDKSFVGSYVLGMGFVLTPEEAQALIEKDPRNQDVLFPYLNGQDLNSNPDQSPSRWVINFFDWALDAEHDNHKKPKGAPYAADYPDCLAIVEEKVKPERAKNNRKVYRDYWWHYAEKRPALYDAIAECDRVFSIPRVSKYLTLSACPTNIVMSEATVVIASESFADFAILQCTFHEEWTRTQGSSLETRMRYTPSDCFETFPFPTSTTNLEEIGEKYYTHRQSIMQSRQEGLTKTYNRFHNPDETDSDIEHLRQLHIEMDNAVAAAYDWQDIDLEHDFHETKQGLRYTISETARREILDRLLQLNHERYAEEKAQGLHDKKKKKGKSKKKKGKTQVSPGQTSLF